MQHVPQVKSLRLSPMIAAFIRGDLAGYFRILFFEATNLDRPYHNRPRTPPQPRRLCRVHRNKQSDGVQSAAFHARALGFRSEYAAAFRSPAQP